ncbi:MAG: sulfatase [Verrucomicrobiales bacterium]
MTHPTFRPTPAVLLSILVLSLAATPDAAGADRPHVLFLVADDLRPDLGCYGNPAVDTPHLDRLAAEGLRFGRAYCQIPSCGPSRASFLTGRRPDATGIYDNRESFRKYLPDAVTLPQHFKNHGYFTMSLGKVFHGKFQSEIREDPVSWSAPAWRPAATQYLERESIAVLENRYPEVFDGGRPLEELMNLRRFKGPAWEAPDAADADLTDGRTAARAVEVLGDLAGRDEPFFLAVGFVKPHAPFVAPRRYFEKVRRDRVRMPKVRRLPEGSPDLASTSREMHGYHGVPERGIFPDETTAELNLAYEACVNYIDAQVGKVIAELERLGLREETLIVFASDHGYHLGEVGQWCKNTNFEEALRVPLVVSSPDPSHARGRASNALVELVDLHPALSELCGLPVHDEIEGTSFAPLLDDPDRPWKRAAFSQHAAKLYDPEAPVGRSLRTADFRYVQWQGPGGTIVAEELYDMDGTLTPDRNLAGDPERSGAVERMRDLLAGGWETARPTPR